MQGLYYLFVVFAAGVLGSMIPSIETPVTPACDPAQAVRPAPLATRLVGDTRIPPNSMHVLRGGGAGKQHTFAMIKPDVASDAAAVADIKRLIVEAGFVIEREKSTHLSLSKCESFYAEHKERVFFGELTEFMSSGPVVMLELSGEGAIKGWRQLIGPTNSDKARAEAPGSVRALFGADQQRNAVHGSDSPEAAAREIALMLG